MVDYWVVFIHRIFDTAYDIPGQQKKKDSPLDILKKIFASGEINKEEYQEQKQNLANDLTKH
jgi:putative membrane protein